MCALWLVFFTRFCYSSMECSVATARCYLSMWNAVPSPRGALVGLAPQTMLQVPQMPIWNTVTQWSFIIFRMSSSPCTNVKPPQLKTFWRRFWWKAPSHFLTRFLACFLLLLKFQVTRLLFGPSPIPASIHRLGFGNAPPRLLELTKALFVPPARKRWRTFYLLMYLLINKQPMMAGQGLKRSPATLTLTWIERACLFCYFRISNLAPRAWRQKSRDTWNSEGRTQTHPSDDSRDKSPRVSTYKWRPAHTLSWSSRPAYLWRHQVQHLIGWPAASFSDELIFVDANIRPFHAD